MLKPAEIETCIQHLDKLYTDVEEMRQDVANVYAHIWGNRLQKCRERGFAIPMDFSTFVNRGDIGTAWMNRQHCPYLRRNTNGDGLVVRISGDESPVMQFLADGRVTLCVPTGGTGRHRLANINDSLTRFELFGLSVNGGGPLSQMRYRINSAADQHLLNEWLDAVQEYGRAVRFAADIAHYIDANVTAFENATDTLESAQDVAILARFGIARGSKPTVRVCRFSITIKAI